MSVEDHFRTFLKFYSSLHFVPDYHIRTKTFKTSTPKIYALCATIIIAYTISGYYVITEAIAVWNNFWFITNISGHIVGIFTFCHVIRLRELETSFRSLFNIFDEIDHSVYDIKKHTFPPLQYFKLLATVTTVWSIASILWDGYIWANSDFTSLTGCLILYCLSLYYILIPVALEHNILRSINARMQYFNRLLEIDTPMDLDKTTPVLVKMYSDIFCSVQLFNTIFGWHILILHVHNILNVLVGVESVISQLFEAGGSNTPFMINHIFYFTCIILSTMSEKLTSEHRKAVGICCKVRQNCRNNDAANMKLQILHQQLVSNGLGLSAAGFFDINYNMTFNFVNIVINYTIVLIQFSPRKNFTDVPGRPMDPACVCKLE